MQARRFFLDTQSRQFVGGFDRTFLSSAPAFFEEDVESVELYFLQPTGDPVTPYTALDYSANTVKLAVGLTAPAALQTSWTAASTTITATISSVTNGGGGANEVQRLTFSGRQPTSGGVFLTMASRAVTVSSVAAGVFTASNHGLLDGQAVALSSFTISGSTFANSTYIVRDRTPNTFKITATAGGDAIAAAVTSGGGTATLPSISTPVVPASELTASALQAAFFDAGLQLNGQAQVLVSGSYLTGFNISFTNSQGNINFDNLAVSSTLAAAAGLTGNLSFNTNEVAALISAGTTSNLRMEVEVSDGTRRQTYATAAAISNDIIVTSSPAPLPPGGAPYTTLTLTDGAGGNWALSIDADGVVTTTKL